MHLFIEKGMRGGISYTAKRFTKASNVNTCNVMTIRNQVNTLHILMQIIYMVWQ